MEVHRLVFEHHSRSHLLPAILSTRGDQEHCLPLSGASDACQFAAVHPCCSPSPAAGYPVVGFAEPTPRHVAPAPRYTRRFPCLENHPFGLLLFPERSQSSTERSRVEIESSGNVTPKQLPVSTLHLRIDVDHGEAPDDVSIER